MFHKTSQSPFLEEKEAENIKLQHKILNLVTKYGKLENKYKEVRVYYKLFKHCSLIQCRYWNKYYKQSSFVTHCQTCSISAIGTTNKEDLSHIKISIIQTLIKEDETLK